MTNTYRSVQHRRNAQQDSAYKRIYSNYKSQAKKDGREFNLDFNAFKRLIRSDCYICGKPPSILFKRSGRIGLAMYNGIDRIDSSLGYTASNTRPCCSICNRMKSDFKMNKFKKHIKRIAETGLLFKPKKDKV